MKIQNWVLSIENPMFSPLHPKVAFLLVVRMNLTMFWWVSSSSFPPFILMTRCKSSKPCLLLQLHVYPGSRAPGQPQRQDTSETSWTRQGEAPHVVCERSLGLGIILVALFCILSSLLATSPISLDFSSSQLIVVVFV